MTTEFPREELRTLIASLANYDISRVLWDGEPIPFLGPDELCRTGCIVLDVIATRAVGVDEENVEYNVDIGSVLYTRVTYSGVRVRTIQVRAEQYDGNEGVSELHDPRESEQPGTGPMSAPDCLRDRSDLGLLLQAA